MAQTQETYNRVNADEAIRAWDMDGDGHINALDMAVAQDKQLNLDTMSNGWSTRKMVCFVVTISMVVIATMLLTTLLANELSKESSPNADSELVDRNSNIVQTQNAESLGMPAEQLLASLNEDELRDLETINLLSSFSKAAYHFKVGGYKRIDNRLELFTTSPAYPKILISGGMVKLLKDGQTDGEGEIISVSESNEEGRRLLRIRKGSSNAHCGFRRKLRRFFRRWRFHKNDKHKKCFCHLNKVYRVNKVYPTAGNPANEVCNLVKYPVYKRKCTHERFWEFHQGHGDILGENNGAQFSLLNDKGKALVNPTFPNVSGIQNMYFDAECEPADPCTIEQQDLCDRVGRQPCQPGSNTCGPEIEVVPPFDDEGSDSDLFF